MSEKILQALRQLDPANPNHWTADGAPRLDTLKMLVGDSTLTREAVSAAWPGYGRATAEQPAVQGGSTSPQPEPALAAIQGASQGSNDGTVQEGGAGAGTNPEGETVAEAAKRQLAEARRIADAALAEKAKANRAAAEAVAAVDRAIEASEKAGNTETHAQTVTGYLAAQQLIRDERAAKKAALKGVNLKDILPSKAMLDEAFKRRTGRGMKRPSAL
jgi:hypothetical protein